MEPTSDDTTVDLSAVVGFDEMTPEERARSAAEIGMVLYKRALLTMLGNFSEAEQATFATFLDTLGPDDDMVSKTIAQYPQLAELLAEEAVLYRELAVTVLDHEV